MLDLFQVDDVGFGDLLEGQDFVGGRLDLLDSAESTCTKGFDDLVF